MSGYTQAQLDALRSMIAKGIKKGKLANGEELEFRSLDEMFLLEAKIEKALGQGGTSAVHYPEFSRGT